MASLICTSSIILLCKDTIAPPYCLFPFLAIQLSFLWSRLWLVYSLLCNCQDHSKSEEKTAWMEAVHACALPCYAPKLDLTRKLLSDSFYPLDESFPCISAGEWVCLYLSKVFTISASCAPAWVVSQRDWWGWKGFQGCRCRYARNAYIELDGCCMLQCPVYIALRSRLASRLAGRQLLLFRLRLTIKSDREVSDYVLHAHAEHAILHCYYWLRTPHEDIFQ